MIPNDKEALFTEYEDFRSKIKSRVDPNKVKVFEKKADEFINQAGQLCVRTIFIIF